MDITRNMKFWESIRKSAKIIIRNRGDSIFLSISIAFGIILTFILTGIATGYYAYEAGGGKPVVRKYLIAGPVPEAKPTHEILGIDQLSVLIIGTDEYLEYDPGRSDTIIWAYLDFRNETVDILSIPRDMVIWIPKRTPDFDKICHAYSYGGADLVKRAVEGFIGVKIDQVVKVDYSGFVDIIDTLDGVTIDVEKDMNYDDRRGNLHIHITKGLQVLDGRESLNYVRFRHDRKGDLGRIERQQKFLTALKKKGLKFGQIGNIDGIARIVEDSVLLEPSMDLRNLTSIILFFTKISDESVNFHSVPVARDILYNELAMLAPFYSEFDKMMRGILSENVEDEAPLTGDEILPDTPVIPDFEDV